MKRVAAVVSVTLALAIAGLVSAASPEADVAVQLFKFRPERVEVRAGTRVTWTNQDDIGHTVTSGTPQKPDRAFDLRLAGKGVAGSVDFPRPGIFPFFCERHQAMRGEIHVN